MGLPFILDTTGKTDCFTI